MINEAFKTLLVLAGITTLFIGGTIMFHQLRLFGLEPLAMQNSGVLIVLLFLLGGACIKAGWQD